MPTSTKESKTKEPFSIAIVYEESERQAVLLALAHLAIERPGWDYMLSQIALKMDNEVGGRPEMFDQFKGFTFPEKKKMWAQFHKLWGLAHDCVYEKNEWMELQALLTKLFNDEHINANRIQELGPTAEGETAGDNATKQSSA